MLRIEGLVFAAVIVGAYSQVIGMGECPQVEVLKDFDASKYVGLWYEYERYPLIWEIFGKCVTAEYTANDDNSIGVHNEQINTIFGTKQTINGTAYYDGPQNEAKLTVVFPGILGSNMHGSYWVLGTDYENWAVVWSCKYYSYFQFTSSWILTREAKPSADILNKAYEIVDKNKIDRRYYSRTDQNDCPRQ